VEKDRKFQSESTSADVDFWVRFAFGETWASKKSRIRLASPHAASSPGWDLTSIIVKANDDLRQEAFMMQLIELSKEAFVLGGLRTLSDLPTYSIVPTGSRSGIIQTIQNALSLDSLKKREDWTNLDGWFTKNSDVSQTVQMRKMNFVKSLAAYSLICHIFEVKDRHNGNILLDIFGNIVHIDFGFILGIRPGGAWSLETAPFKLTREMIDVMGGLSSRMFSDFVTTFCTGFLALQASESAFVTLVEITAGRGGWSQLPCFKGLDVKDILEGLRGRFCTNLGKAETVSHCLNLIRLSINSYGTKNYDNFQYYSNGIHV